MTTEKLTKEQAEKIEIYACWKHHRELDNEGWCRDCNGKPPNKPKAYSDTIKEASIKLSYAFSNVKNEGQREYIAKYWEDKLRHLISHDYDIIEVKKE